MSIIDPDLYEIYVLDCRIQKLQQEGLPYLEELRLYTDLVLAFNEKVMRLANAASCTCPSNKPN